MEELLRVKKICSKNTADSNSQLEVEHAHEHEYSSPTNFSLEYFFWISKTINTLLQSRFWRKEVKSTK